MSIAVSGLEILHSYAGDENERPDRNIARRGQSISMIGMDRDIEQSWNASVDYLLRLRTIGDDWDGEGAVAPFPEIVDSAIALVRSDDFRRDVSNAPPARIMPRNDGRLTLEWFFGEIYLSVRVDAPGTARCMYISPTGKEEFFSWNWLS